MDQTGATDRVYQIGEIEYRLEPLSWQQTKWLGEHIFGGIDLAALDYRTIHNLLRDKGPLFMAICLLPAGVDRRTHSQRPWREIEATAREFAGLLTGGEVALFGPHFFSTCRPDQMVLLMDGDVLQRTLLALAASGSPGDSGSSAASSSSPTAMSPSSAPSSVSGAQPTPSPISSDGSSGDSATSPS